MLTRLAAGAALALAGSCAAAWAQDAMMGRQIAQEWCSGCHAVDDRPPHSDAVPSFRSIAHARGTTRLSLIVFLSTPHHRMPDYHLTTQEMDDISAYILSLK